MKKYIVIYYAPTEAMEKMKDSSPEEMKEGMEAWNSWAEKCGEGLVDLGTPLGNGQMISSAGANPSDKGVVGYSILQAETMEGAESMLLEHPHLAWTEGCSIEVHEALPIPQ